MHILYIMHILLHNAKRLSKFLLFFVRILFYHPLANIDTAAIGVNDAGEPNCFVLSELALLTKQKST
jgi:hypothetical protein